MGELKAGFQRLVVLASGEGTNAMNLVSFFGADKGAAVVMILTNNPQAGIIGRAKVAGVPCEVMERAVWADGNALLSRLLSFAPDLVVLAGYIRQIPRQVVDAFRGRMINIHPALLPNYGGKGMYGARVHEAVLAAGEKKSGITIHLVDEEYDSGKILFQAEVEIQPGWTAADLQKAVHELEYKHFPAVIHHYLRQLQTAL